MSELKPPDTDWYPTAYRRPPLEPKARTRDTVLMVSGFTVTIFLAILLLAAAV